MLCTTCNDKPGRRLNKAACGMVSAFIHFKSCIYIYLFGDQKESSLNYFYNTYSLHYMYKTRTPSCSHALKLT